ncbi:ribonuclease H2, subunit B [Whalleya microplaca]|nr:ribonuclease H2, subunit B [Whalleya microplaca]
MARTTRSKAKAPTHKTASEPTPTTTSKSRYTLPAESTNPPKLFILPKKATKEARIVSLLNPRYAKPTRYLVCPETGVYEFTRIAAPRSTPRSWMIEWGTGEVEAKTDQDGAYITRDADLYVATPIDPLFLVLPAFATGQPNKAGKRMFVSSDDHFDAIHERSPHLSEILRCGTTRALLEARMAAVCDTADAGDETMFRFSEDKLLAEVLAKARKMSESALPRSMEEKFVTKALEAPFLGVKREEATVSVSQTQTQNETETTESGASGASTPKVESVDSRVSASSTSTTDSSTSDASTAATSVTEAAATLTIAAPEQFAPSISASPSIVALQRLRTAFNFISSSYLPPTLTATLKAKLAEPNSSVDLGPLDAYLGRLAQLRQEAAAARSLGDYSRKRVLDDEELADRAEKKARREEEEKRKKSGESRGVKNLKKVNTAGMKKMSDFFKKK